MEILSSRIVQIKKSQYCPGCAKKYQIGTKMEKVAYKDLGQLSNTYWCMTCKKIMNRDDDWFDNNEYLGTEGDVRDGDVKEWEKTYKQVSLENDEQSTRRNIDEGKRSQKNS